MSSDVVNGLCIGVVRRMRVVFVVWCIGVVGMSRFARVMNGGVLMVRGVGVCGLRNSVMNGNG